ncbi:MAG: non-canonical purine NTP pyrophosphatase [Candidatus Woesearchaeota archaeon]|nr:non-canonical purine NTP pyrophosphatase [Candidatus Woesearchaeota archaeon]
MNRDNRLKLAFVTTNKHKFEEVRDVLSEFGIETEWINEESLETEGEIDVVAKQKAKHACSRFDKTLVVEDTGLFFEAYNNFPGPNPKFVFNSIGYDGIMRLLKGKSRKAHFRTVAAYCIPGKGPKLFDGIMKGEITEKVFNPKKDAMPYDRIFIPEEYDKTISDMTLKEKNTFSQRAKAFRKLGEYLAKKR